MQHPTVEEYHAEEWRKVPGYERYAISSLGRVAGIMKPILKQFLNTQGYLGVNLCRDGTGTTKRVSMLMALAFIGKRPEGYHVCHLNGNKLDNRLVNLKYVTPKENESHKRIHGTALYGEKKPTAKLIDEDVIFIIKNYKPYDKQFGSTALGKRFGVSKSVVSGVANGNGWKHVHESLAQK